MHVLVIPDVHLKPWMFDVAKQLSEEYQVDRHVCLMDIADDWGKENDIGAYLATYDKAIDFAQCFPDTLWCYGNHDISYVWNMHETGYSPAAQYAVRNKLMELSSVLQKPEQLAFVQRIDNVVFSHGGISDYFVQNVVPYKYRNDIDKVISFTNEAQREILWNDVSPLWFRPQYSCLKMYKPRKILQVVGHTPVSKIEKRGNLISCDVFSTRRDGEPIGTQEFLYLDTETFMAHTVSQKGMFQV